MNKRILGIAIVAMTLAGAVFAYHVTFGRTDCPGKIICPLTGQVICADQCPMASHATATAEVPSCCKGAKTAP